MHRLHVFGGRYLEPQAMATEVVDGELVARDLPEFLRVLEDMKEKVSPAIVCWCARIARSIRCLT